WGCGTAGSSACSILRVSLVEGGKTRWRLITCLVFFAASPVVTTCRSHPAVKRAPQGPRSSTVTYHAMCRGSIGRPNEVTDHVVPGDSPHRPAVLTGHDRRMNVVHH